MPDRDPTGAQGQISPTFRRRNLPPLLVNNHSLFVIVSVSLSLWCLTFFSFSDDPVITVLVPIPLPFPIGLTIGGARLKTGKCADGKGGGENMDNITISNIYRPQT
jgi:hypothetical protein